MVHLMADGQFSYVQYSQAHLATSSVIVAPPLREASCRSEGLSLADPLSRRSHSKQHTSITTARLPSRIYGQASWLRLANVTGLCFARNRLRGPYQLYEKVS